MTWWAPRPERAAEGWQDFACVVAWLLGLQLLDLLTTMGALGHGAVEANPAVAGLLDSHGPAVLVQVKLVAIVLVLGWLPAYHLASHSRVLAAGMLAVMLTLAVFYSAVVVNNLVVLTAQLGR